MKLILNRYVLIAFIFAIFFMILGYQATHSYFSNSSVSSTNTFTAASVFPTVIPSVTPTSTTGHLVINEVMFDPPSTSACGTTEGDSEWVEIYNPTSNPVNLDTWSIGDENSVDDLPNISIPSGSFAVVSDCPQNSFISIWPIPLGTIYIDLPGPIGTGLNNIGEHVRLINETNLIDGISYGTNTNAFSPSIPAPVSDRSIERDPDGIDTDTASDFVVRTTPSPGL